MKKFSLVARMPDESGSLHRARFNASRLQIAGRSHRAARLLLVHAQCPAFVAEIGEQIQVLSFSQSVGSHPFPSDGPGCPVFRT
jgi:hypothetical protein